MIGGAVAVLLVGAGAPWEAPALAVIEAAPGVVVLRRCMDVTDLMAHAAAGDAHVALVAAEAPGLDADAVRRLRRDGVETLVVLAELTSHAIDRLHAIGVHEVTSAAAVDDLGPAIRKAATAAGSSATPRLTSVTDESPDVLEDPASGWSVAVWGPAGAPGRTTVALGLASELAARGADPLLIDADPWGGAVAQRLGVLDEVSGLLAAARLIARGEGEVALRTAARRVGSLRLVSGLPRPDRWHEVGADVLDALVAGDAGFRVLDTGASLEDDSLAELTGRPGRNALTLSAIGGADAVVAVGTPDPVGLARLARGLDDLQSHLTGQPVHVVLNRWRPRLGIDAREARRLLEGFATIASLHLLPDDPLTADRSLVTGRTLHESGASALVDALGTLADTVFPSVVGTLVSERPRVRRRRAAGARRR